MHTAAAAASKAHQKSQEACVKKRPRSSEEALVFELSIRQRDRLVPSSILAMRASKLLLLAILCIQISFNLAANNDPQDADDFAEFDFDDENEGAKKPQLKTQAEDDDFDDDDEEFVSEPSPPKAKKVVEEEVEDAVVEDVDSEFNHFADEEEFEGFNTEDEEEEDEFEHMSTKGRGAKEKVRPKPGSQPTIKIANIPMMRTQWENYYLEMLMVAGIVVYFLNFFTGKTKNQKIATSWFNSHRPILESNFTLIGDDGSKNIEEVETPLQKESEHLFTLWCSGRVCCEGMLVELKLLKRQDLVAVISNLMKPSNDQVSTYSFILLFHDTS